MNKQELLDEAVADIKGGWPEGVCKYIKRVERGRRWLEFKVEPHAVSQEEFQQRARELGYLDEYFAVRGIDQQKIKNTLISDIAEPESWYCYETQKALRLPPVGEVCQMYAAALWFDVKVIGEDDGKPIVKYMDCGNYYPASPAEKFYRPLDHETRKAEAERKRVVDAAAAKFHASIMPDYSGQPFIDGLSALYDAGFLRMPEDK